MSTDQTIVSMNECESEADYDQTATSRRSFGHVMRSCALLLGIWIYFLFADCIPAAAGIKSQKNLVDKHKKYIRYMEDNVSTDKGRVAIKHKKDELKDDEHKLTATYVNAVGSGTASSCAFVLMVLCFRGVRRSFKIRAVSFTFLALYVASSLLWVIGASMLLKIQFQSSNDLMTSEYKCFLVGRVVGPAFVLIASFFVVAPDFGLAN